MLRTIQITVPKELLDRIDVTVAEMDTNRSQFARKAFEDALFSLWVERMEREDQASYLAQPEDPVETGLWHSIPQVSEPYEEG